MSFNALSVTPPPPPSYNSNNQQSQSAQNAHIPQPVDLNLKIFENNFNFNTYKPFQDFSQINAYIPSNPPNLFQQQQDYLPPNLYKQFPFLLTNKNSNDLFNDISNTAQDTLNNSIALYQLSSNTSKADKFMGLLNYSIFSNPTELSTFNLNLNSKFNNFTSTDTTLDLNQFNFNNLNFNLNQTSYDASLIYNNNLLKTEINNTISNIAKQNDLNNHQNNNKNKNLDDDEEYENGRNENYYNSNYLTDDDLELAFLKESNHINNSDVNMFNLTSNLSSASKFKKFSNTNLNANNYNGNTQTTRNKSNSRKNESIMDENYDPINRNMLKFYEEEEENIALELKQDKQLLTVLAEEAKLTKQLSVEKLMNYHQYQKFKNDLVEHGDKIEDGDDNELGVRFFFQIKLFNLTVVFKY